MGYDLSKDSNDVIYPLNIIRVVNSVLFPQNGKPVSAGTYSAMAHPMGIHFIYICDVVKNSILK